MGFLKFAKKGTTVFAENLQKLKEYHGGYDYKNFWQNGIEPFEAGQFFYAATIKTVRKVLAENPEPIRWFMRFVIVNRLINFNLD